MAISMTLVAVALAFPLAFAGSASAATAVSLGSAKNYAVLAGSTVTNTGATVLTGDLGLSPGTSVTGFPPGTVSASTNVANTAAGTAQNDLTAAYLQAAGEGPVSATSAATLGAGQTLTPGVYNSASSINFTGALTLNGGGDSGAVFIFQAGSALNVANSASVVLTNGAQAGCVFWQVGSSATLGTSSSFAGTVLALTSITANTSATVNGALLARNGAVTLDSNTITVPAACLASSATTTTVAPAATPTTATTTPRTAATTTTTPAKSATTTTTKSSSSAGSTTASGSSATTKTSSSSGSSTVVPTANPSPTSSTSVKVTG